VFVKEIKRKFSSSIFNVYIYVVFVFESLKEPGYPQAKILIKKGSKKLKFEPKIRPNFKPGPILSQAKLP
jgi:hypothetical protein